jgi:hypothetical protein
MPCARCLERGAGGDRETIIAGTGAYAGARGRRGDGVGDASSAGSVVTFVSPDAYLHSGA